MSCKCKDCGLIYDGFSGEMVILNDSLWYEVSKGKPNICLCDKCIEKRLDRDLTIDDLKPNVPVNNVWIMTKGEQEAYALMQSTLSSLIFRVKSYCRDYDCGRELLIDCKNAENALNESHVLFNKGKRKKQ